jgi:hypothetical protein
MSSYAWLLLLLLPPPLLPPPPDGGCAVAVTWCVFAG